MSDDGYRLPGVSRAGVPQHLQLKPHESFQPEAVAPREPMRLTVGEPLEAFKATPPDWTDRPDLPCSGRWHEWDEPNATLYRKVVLPGCLSCPVRDPCLESALEEEKGLGAAFRAGVRGGLLPRDRVRAEKGLRPMSHCSKGHPWTEENTRFSRGRGWEERHCRACDRVYAQARKERQKAAEAAA